MNSHVSLQDQEVSYFKDHEGTDAIEIIPQGNLAEFQITLVEGELLDQDITTRSIPKMTEEGGMENREQFHLDVGRQSVQNSPRLLETETSAETRQPDQEILNSANNGENQKLVSPVEMDIATQQQQGQDLQGMLRMFKEAHTTPLSNCIL
jgi:hypothetical protein